MADAARLTTNQVVLSLERTRDARCALLMLLPFTQSDVWMLPIQAFSIRSAISHDLISAGDPPVPSMNASKLEASCGGSGAEVRAYILEGGLDAWKSAGLPVVKDASQPLELQRQVQIAAGAMIVLGFVLGISVSPWFHLLSGFVGAGLMFAGISGFCGLARLLVRMPWNRKAMRASTVCLRCLITKESS